MFDKKAGERREYTIWGGIGPIFGGKRALTRVACAVNLLNATVKPSRIV